MYNRESLLSIFQTSSCAALKVSIPQNTGQNKKKLKIISIIFFSMYSFVSYDAYTFFCYG